MWKAAATVSDNDVTFNCGCSIAERVVHGEKLMIVQTCGPDCETGQMMEAEIAKSGKPVDYYEI